MLLDQLFLGYWELRSENEVGQCILMENADRVQSNAVALEVDAVFSGTEAVDRLLPSGKSAQRLLGTG